jgi:suppressor of fused
VSGFGFELTLRLKLSAEDAKVVAEADQKIKHKTSNYLLEHVPKWPINMLNNLARYVFNTHRTFDVGSYADDLEITPSVHSLPILSCIHLSGDHMNLNGPICFSSETQIRAALFAPDSSLPGSIRTPYGMVKFIQFVGITEDEYELTWEWSSSGLLDVRT